MSWAPAGLTEPLLSFARAVEATFAPLRPKNPPRLPPIPAADLTPALAERHPYAQAIDSTNGKLVISRPDGAGGYHWRNADGTAL